MTGRSEEQLRQGSLDLFWRLRQVLALSIHLDKLRKAGTVRIFDPLDAAALEAFAINARALIDFLWRTRAETPAPRSTDLLAVEWIAPDLWRPYEQPPHLQPIRAKVGRDIAHLTLGAADPAGWQPREVASSLAAAVAHFASVVPPASVAPDFRATVEDAVVAWRIEIGADDPLFSFSAPGPIPVASPANVTTATELREPDSSHPDVQAWRKRQKGELDDQ